VRQSRRKVKHASIHGLGLRITPAVAAFYNYQIDPPSVEAEASVYAKSAPPRRDFTGFQSRAQREEDEREQHVDQSSASRFSSTSPLSKFSHCK
jgi:hypothetical protein